jgi:hypothetical protein
MNPRPTTSISASFELHLVVPGGENLPVDALLRYDASDPYAVHVGFHTGGDDVVEWTFARQLLTDGVTRSIGEGDVQVWPGPASWCACRCPRRPAQRCSRRPSARWWSS